ncbi:hypothetical protein NC652_038423 [Populus alba x Populus x berolinensis]|uniref:Uncharacterized protein n=1 Tax=Populus tomentosa TaxID=118781 RepID=A0A8X7Y2V9_POPTO|nr:hypothetical protein POTOM_054029 [Populus tomentosa]KAJ6867188.1 hypothetical protein NC652_038423 [Populus alba x Populus x berolinensis]
MLVTYISKMKALLIVCFLLATVVFSPLSTCTARELAERDESGSNDPHKPVFGCGRGQRYCVPKTPPPCKNLYKRNC